MPERLQLSTMLLDDVGQVRLERVGQTQVRRANLDAHRVFDQLVDVAKLLEVAVVEDRNAIADVLNVVETVRAHQHRLALIAKLTNQALHPDGSHRVEARG